MNGVLAVIVFESCCPLSVVAPCGTEGTLQAVAGIVPAAFGVTPHM